MLSDIASKIPKHPKSCKGVKSPEYTLDQCRLCWLATYDRGYQRHWRIHSDAPDLRLLNPEAYYPCIHRDPSKLSAPGCSGCSGLSHVNRCSSPVADVQFCAVDVLGKGAQTARQYGYRLCSECGFREPEQGLEKPVVELMNLLEGSPSTLPEGWKGWRATHHAFQTAFNELCDASHAFPQKKFKDRGIVIGAGGETYFKCAWVVANILRDLGCFLPIQFWYLGRSEMDPAMVDLARSIGIECIDAQAVAAGLEKKPRILAGWELKPFSVIRSKFREVLYLDADCVPVRDPSFLFNCEQYLQHGSIFWPDLPPNGKREWIPPSVWELYGLGIDTTPDFESGQFLVDKSRCWHELQVTMWLNEHSDFVYDHVYGDKSTYHLAWRGCRTPYAMPLKDAGWSSPAIQQYDFEDRVLFQHACQGKAYLMNGLAIGSLEHSTLAVKHAEGWKARWSGQMYKPDFLPEHRRYVLEPGGYPIELFSGGSIKGSTPEIRKWGWSGSQMVLVGPNRSNQIAVDFLSPHRDDWVGSSHRLVKA